MNRLVLVEDGIAITLSEFAMLNAAISCTLLRRAQAESSTEPDSAVEQPGAASRMRTAVILPSVGPLPVLLGIFGSLGLIQEALASTQSGPVLHAGQLVTIDGNAVAKYDGIEEIGGKRCIRLIQYSTQTITSRGRRASQSVGNVRFLPEADLARLDVAPQGTKTRGTIATSQSASEAAVTALEMLFLQLTPIQFTALLRHVLVVTPVTKARELVRRLQLQGQRLSDALPIGHLRSDGDVEVWSSRHSHRLPTLLFVPDLDLAREFIKGAPSAVSLVVVDGAAGCLRQAASLRTIHNELQQGQVLVLARDQDLDEQGQWLESKCGFSLWDWTEEDIAQLWWPEFRDSRPYPISSWERRTQLSTKATVTVSGIPCPEGEAVFEALKDLRRLAARRERDRLEELDRFLDRARRLLFILLRRTTPLRLHAPSAGTIKQSLTELHALERSNYLSSDERTAAAKVTLGLEAFAAALELTNPKGEALRQLLVPGSVETVIVPGETEQQELTAAQLGAGRRVLTAAEAAQFEGDLAGQVVITGWARQDRMAELLRPPIAPKIVLILYQLEQHWFEGYRSSLARRSEQRRKRTSRKAVFPGVPGWPEQRPGSTPAAHGASDGWDIACLPRCVCSTSLCLRGPAHSGRSA
jgi:hypothetical protein